MVTLDIPNTYPVSVFASFDEACLSAASTERVPIFCPEPGWNDDLVDSGSWRSIDQIAPHVFDRSETTFVVADFTHPSAVCARLLAEATGRPLRSVRDYGPGGLSEATRNLIYVLPLQQCHDGFLLGSLEGFSRRLRTERELSQLSSATLVTARNLASLSRMVAKLIDEHRRPVGERAHFRHYAPKEFGTIVSDIWIGAQATALQPSMLTGLDIRNSYADRADVIGFHTHGSEACAKGGDGTVLCGLSQNFQVAAPKAVGTLACGHGLPCPRGPYPFPLSELGAKIVVLGSCNGLRLGDSLTHPDFNFALSFIDGSGLGFVSSVFTSIGGDIASTSFLAATASGLSLGESTALINALLQVGELEHPSFVAIGDYDMKVCRERSAVAQSVDRLPARVDARETRFAEIRVRDELLVNAALTGRLGLRVTRDDGAFVSSGFYRVERGGDDEEPCVVCRLFSFPEPLGAITVEEIDRTSLRETASALLAAMQYWLEYWRLSGLDVELPELFAELLISQEQFQSRLAREVALSSLNGIFISRLEHSVSGLGAMVEIASSSVIQQLIPLLKGGFWLSNLHRVDRFVRSDREFCPSCSGPALAKTLQNVMTGNGRKVIICPRCGIAADMPHESGLAGVAIDLNEETINAGKILRVSIRVKGRRASNLQIYPRLSTHNEDAPAPAPEEISVTLREDDWLVCKFDFNIPENISPHRHYVKVLLATAEGLSFASRPFFVTPAVGQMS